MLVSAADDRQHLGELADRFGPAVRGFLARRLSNPADVEDLSQEVFVRLSRHDDLKGISNVEGYILQVAANLLKNRYRTTSRTLTVVPFGLGPVAHQEAEAASPERILMDKEALAGLLRALAELPERTRAILILNRLDGLKAHQIASRLDISVSLVSKEMMRAAAFLRTLDL
ncbi:RNA polymerase sigma factor (plasmid) [Brevundimonas staleyi]|uniref:RNA polymerase sigma factor n=1 Tax=Brevundimonas staleyi TaxID=74326 RepID=A0ABW0FP51_9CAUL